MRLGSCEELLSDVLELREVTEAGKWLTIFLGTGMPEPEVG